MSSHHHKYILLSFSGLYNLYLMRPQAETAAVQCVIYLLGEPSSLGELACTQ